MIAISEINTNRYFELKAVVKKSFFEAAAALKEINERKLYLAEFNSFDDFCKSEIGVGRQRGYELINAAQVVENVRGRVQILPENEYIARPLTKLEPEDQVEVWEKVTSENETITHDIVKNVVRKHIQERQSEENIGIVPESDLYREEVSRPPLTGPDEKRTPEEIYHAAFFALRGVTLDPCADEDFALPVSRHFSKVENGLVLPWSGRVFVHPPASLVEEFIAKAVNELEEENIEAAVLYLPVEPWQPWHELIKIYPRAYTRKDPEYKSGRMIVLLENENIFFGSFEEAVADIGPLYGYLGE